MPHNLPNRGQADQPYARGQGVVPSTGPYLGGFRYVLTAAVGAAGTITIAPGFVPNHVEVESVPLAVYPSRVQLGVGARRGPRATDVTFENAQPVGTVLFLY